MKLLTKSELEEVSVDIQSVLQDAEALADLARETRLRLRETTARLSGAPAPRPHGPAAIRKAA